MQFAEKERYRRINNVRSSERGRTLGKGNLSDAVKLGIITDKKLQIMSQPAIASKYDVARFTVNRLTENDLSPEAKVKYEKFVDKLGAIKEKTADLLIEKLDAGTIKESTLTGLLDISNKNHRLEMSLPTNITQSNDNLLNVLVTALQRDREYYQRYPNAEPRPADYWLSKAAQWSQGKCDPETLLSEAQKQLESE